MEATLDLPNPDAWLDVGQVSEMLGLDRSYLYRMIDDGRLPAYKIGAHRVFWRAQVVEIRNARAIVRGNRR